MADVGRAADYSAVRKKAKKGRMRGVTLKIGSLGLIIGAAALMVATSAAQAEINASGPLTLKGATVALN